MITSGQYDLIKDSFEKTKKFWEPEEFEKENIWGFYRDIEFEITKRKGVATTYGLMRNPSSYKSMQVPEIPKEPHETIGEI